MKLERMPSPCGSVREGIALALAFVAALAISPTGTASPLTSDELRAPGEAMPEAPLDGPAEKRTPKLDYSTVSPALRIVLPPPSEEEVESTKRGTGKSSVDFTTTSPAPGAMVPYSSEEGVQSTKQAAGAGPLVVGFHRDLPDAFKDDLSPRLDWKQHSDGSFVSSVSVTTPGAESVRVGIRAELPPGGEIRFFRPDSDERFMAATREDLHFVEGVLETLWSPTVDGDTIGIEVSLPSTKALGGFSLTVDTVAHTLVSTKALPRAHKLDCPDLHIDVACRDSSIDDDNENAVARIRFEEGGISYLCSGTLMNDKDPSTTIPYFLTANHCVGTAVVARTVEAHWFYQTARCDADSLDSRYATTAGADLLTTNASYDLSLLRMRGAMPGGVYFAGWSASSLDHPANVYGIHHPDGAVKSYTAGATRRNVNSLGFRNTIQVQWSEGTTEGGSSGSGLFLREGGYLVGGLSHGEACGPRINDHYGPFKDFFPQVTDWLSAGGTSPSGDDHGNTRETASVVTVPSSTPGNLEAAGDSDYFQFTIDAPGTIRVYTTGTTDTYGTLTRADGGDAQHSDDGGAGENFRIEVTEAPAGSYFVQVRAFSSSTTGAYTLHVASSEGALGTADHVLPLLTEAGNTQRQGFVRVINRSERAGTVIVHAIDDSGRRFGPTTLSLDATESLNFNSRDLEQGNPTVGLSGGVGDEGSGDWRVELRTDLDIEARAYIRTRDGFLTAMQDVAVESTSEPMRYHVPFFNPASNTSLVSWLRVINPGSSAAAVEISGLDADGRAAPGGSVRFTLASGAARLISAQQLESGASDLNGRLGDGRGKWQLWVSSDQPIQVMGLMRTRSGHLSNLSH